MTTEEQRQIIDLINREVLPAIGCTEPIAVSLGVAKAAELLGTRPKKINLKLSANILKNAMGVGIPGTGMIGLPIAVALGALIGKSDYQLEVLRDTTPEAVEEGKKFIAEKRISIEHKDTPEKLFIEVECRAGDKSAKAIIAGAHTNFIYLEQDGKVLKDTPLAASSESGDSKDPELTLAKVYEFATTTPIDDLRFILKTKELNKAVSDASLKGDYGHALGRTIRESLGKHNIFGDTTHMHIMSATAAACDARMAGAPIPVMSNSGSGNQGISATMPVVVYAEDNNVPDAMLIRALALSHLTVIYIKQSLGRLSALCGCVVAATGSACGLTYMMGGGYEQVTYAVKNMVASLTGMLCDGAKPSCALKVASGASTAVMCAILAVDNRSVTEVEGIIDRSVDKSIKNMTAIGRDGMAETDKLVLDIMTNK